MANDDGCRQSYVLGIDPGSASLGWAAIGLEQDGKPSKLLREGVRIFDPAVSGDIEKGQDESNAVARRSARLIRSNCAEGQRANASFSGFFSDIHSCLK
jgi:CRISPR/Cas system Type II protein with McrA/HNH and RuvC-like nuclease domain